MAPIATQQLRNETLTCHAKPPSRGRTTTRSSPCRFAVRLWQEPCPEVESEAARTPKGAKRTLQAVRNLSVRTERPHPVRWRILEMASDSRAEIPRIGL